MKRIKAPSPAMVVAVISLIVATTGGAFAAGLITGAGIKNSSVTGLDIKDSSLTGADVKNGSLATADLSAATVASLKGLKGDPGAKGDPGVKGDQGPKGDTGLKGDTGAPGTARAFAKVAADGTVDVTNSQGVTQTNITHPSTGVYCVAGLAFTPRSLVTTTAITAGGVAPGPIVGVDLGPMIGCPAGTQATIATVNNNVFRDQGFYVMFN